MSSIPDQLFEKPDLYWVKYAGNQAVFASMTRESYFQSIFTDSARIMASLPSPTLIELDKLLFAGDIRKPNPLPINFIFHTANCGSTILSRALDLPERTIAYREPYPLRQLGVEYALNDTNLDLSQWRRALKVALLLLNRRYNTAEVPIVKTNIPVNFMVSELLELIPDYRAVLLYSRLESFLVSVLKSPSRRKWAILVSNEVGRSIEPILGLPINGIDSLSVSQRAAALWLAQIAIFQKILPKNGKIYTLESDHLFDKPEETLFRVASLFGVTMSNKEVSEIVSGSLFQRHSKNPGIAYSVETRNSDQSRLYKMFYPEIQEGMLWVEIVLQNRDITNVLSNSVFDI